MRKCFSLLVFIILLLFMAVPSLASDAPFGRETLSVSHNESNSIDVNVFDPQSGELILVWHGMIQETGAGKVDLYGYTQTKKVCNIVEVRLVLQQWTGSAWKSMQSFTYTGYYTDLAYGSKELQVERGKYYRLRTYHEAVDNYVVDEKDATTDAIYVK